MDKKEKDLIRALRDDDKRRLILAAINAYQSENGQHPEQKKAENFGRLGKNLGKN